jgi:predicted ribosome quality control (RQC) complex YloA/Tae2 family protein
MEPKRELTSVDLRALATELGRYEGAKVDKAYLYGEDLLRLKLRDFDRGRVELLIEVGDTKRVHVADQKRVPDAPGRPPNFAKMLRNRLSGADFAGVTQYEFDRILTFEFERPDADTTIVAELFGDGNIAVLDETEDVVESLNTVRLKSRTVAPGSQYGYPKSRIDPLSVDFDAFAAKMAQSDTDVVRTLATQINFGGLYAEEVCARAGIEKTLDIEEADETTYRELYDAIGRLSEPLETGDLDPRIYLEPVDGEEPSLLVDVTPFPLEEHEERSTEAFDSFNEALDEYFYRLQSQLAAAEESGGESARPDFEEQIAKQERIIQQQEGAIEGFEQQAERERERAELLYANYELADDVLSTIQQARAQGVSWDEIEETLQAGAEQGISAAEAVLSVDGAKGTVTVEIEDTAVELDATTGVEKNADRLYQEAKRIEEKREGALEAIEDTRDRLAEVKQRREQWEASDQEADESDEPDESPEIDWLSRSSIPIRRPEQWYEQFRWFHTSEDFLVIGGRSATQNEQIVKKYLDSNDLFFHSEAHGGPVTVLKATGPSEPAHDIEIPEQSRKEAAQFAVTYSSVWKEGKFAGDAYMVSPDQVSKTPESGEYLEKGGFAIRGDRRYFEDLPAEVVVGITCTDETRVIGGPPSAIRDRTETDLQLTPGRYAQNDMAKMCYRKFRERFVDESFVRKVASPDLIQEFLPPGGSQIVEE